MTHEKYPDPYSPKDPGSDDQGHGPNYSPSVTIYLEGTSQHQLASRKQAHQTNSCQVVSTPLTSIDTPPITDRNQENPTRPISIPRLQQDDPTYLEESERILGSSPPRHPKSPLQDLDFRRNFLGAGTTRGQSSNKDAVEGKSKKRVRRGKKREGGKEGGKMTEKEKSGAKVRNTKTKMGEDELDMEDLNGQNEKGKGKIIESEKKAVGSKNEKAADDDDEWETTSGSGADESPLRTHHPID